MMIIGALMLFAFTLFCGLLLALMHSLGVERPWPLAFLHGLFAGASIILLGWVVLSGAMPAMKLALTLFVVTAGGGAFLLSYRLRAKALPTVALIVHALLAAAALTALALNFTAIKL